MPTSARASNAARTNPPCASLADKLANTRSILADVRESGLAVFECFSGEREGTLWYYAALADAFRGFPNRMVDELKRTVDALRRLVVP